MSNWSVARTRGRGGVPWDPILDPATELQRLPGPFDQPFGSEQPELTERDHALAARLSDPRRYLIQRSNPIVVRCQLLDSLLICNCRVIHALRRRCSTPSHPP